MTTTTEPVFVGTKELSEARPYLTERRQRHLRAKGLLPYRMIGGKCVYALHEVDEALLRPAPRSLAATHQAWATQAREAIETLDRLWITHSPEDFALLKTQIAILLTIGEGEAA